MPASMLVQRKVTNHEEDMQRCGKFVVALCEKMGGKWLWSHLRHKYGKETRAGTGPSSAAVLA
jgi:hypothetical protein